MTSNTSQYETILISNNSPPNHSKIVHNNHIPSKKHFYNCKKYGFNCENINCSLNKYKTTSGEVYFCSESCLNTSVPFCIILK